MSLCLRGVESTNSPVKRKRKEDLGLCRGYGGSKWYRNDCYEVMVEATPTKAGQMHQLLRLEMWLF